MGIQIKTGSNPILRHSLTADGIVRQERLSDIQQFLQVAHEVAEVAHDRRMGQIHVSSKDAEEEQRG